MNIAVNFHAYVFWNFSIQLCMPPCLLQDHKYIAEILIFEYAHHCILWIWCTPHNCNLLPYLVNIMHTVQHFDCALMSTPLPYLCSCKPWHKRYGWSFINHHKMHYFWLVIWLVLYLWVAVSWIFFLQNAPLYLWKQRIRTYNCFFLQMPICAFLFISSVSFQDDCLLGVYIYLNWYIERTSSLSIN